MQLFQNIGYLDLGKGEMVGALAGCCRGCRAVDRGRGSHVESMASRREMLIEILNYSGFIGGNVFGLGVCKLPTSNVFTDMPVAFLGIWISRRVLCFITREFYVLHT